MPENVLTPPQIADYDLEGKVYRIQRNRARHDVLIGERDVADGDADEFKPALVFRFKEGQCRFKLKYVDAGHANRTIDEIQPRPRRRAIRWRANDPDGVPVTVRWFDKPNDDDFGDSFEFDFTIDSLPPPGPRQNIFRFKLNTTNCEFHYQDPAELPADGYDVNPNLVKGSYAVYSTVPVMGPGKLCHIYTAFVRAANDAGGTYAQSVAAGTGRWCTYNADAQAAGYIDITIPKPWMQSAQFPLRIDPTVGYTTKGSSARRTVRRGRL